MVDPNPAQETDQFQSCVENRKINRVSGPPNERYRRPEHYLIKSIIGVQLATHILDSSIWFNNINSMAHSTQPKIWWAVFNYNNNNSSSLIQFKWVFFFLGFYTTINVKWCVKRACHLNQRKKKNERNTQQFDERIR